MANLGPKRSGLYARSCILFFATCALILHFFQVVSADSRQQELHRLRQLSPDGVIHLNDQSFSRFVRANDRPYSIILFFDAVQYRESSELRLGVLRREFALVAQSYAKKYAGTENEDRIFFCDVEFGESKNAFRHFSVSTLPHFRHIPPGSSSKGDEMAQQEFSREARGISDWVTAKTGLGIDDIERPPLVSKQQMMLIGVSIVVITPFVIRFLLTHHTPLHDPRMWCVGGLCIYLFSVSGGMHNIIRNMPMFMRDNEDPKKLKFFYHGSGAQLGVEGFTVGSLYTIVGIFLAAATHLLPSVKSKALQRLGMAVCVFGGLLAVRQVVSLDQWKTGYWIHAFWPRGWR
eukprot:TRINITY_DN884_c0_g1_i1.p1 TRINITY_DN884_c0_g1~~TRINITY_DN884_c0_g1_i1.p1  ORF type:complete len:347 (+),score=34.81 TRINITY_DN884_c0_g1_i1:38-1078(+)